ncbi:MAG: transporter substrate-binding domain-containing protein [Clostridia bacterium]|nr:transporter substrate-binding domain-containing protein [Clostridia bacterium]
MFRNLFTFRKALSALTALLFALAFVLPLGAFAEESAPKTVRVGYVNAVNYEEGGEGEYKRGFGYEYFQKIASITGWEYEYVHGSFAECYQMLERGEIDLFGNVSLTPARVGKVLFSDYPEGTDTYWIYAGAHREDLLTNDTAKLNGTKIGVTRNSFQEGLLRDWLGERGLDAEIVPCDGFSELMTRLDAGEFDAMAAPDLSTEYGYKIVTMLGTSDFYFAVAKDRPDILAELNEALYEIQTAEPEYNSLLIDRYHYKVASGLFINPAEQEWLAAHGNTIRMGVLANYLPFIGKQDGEYVGVIMNVVEVLESEYGVKTVLSSYPDLAALKAALRAGDVDLIGPVVGDFWLAEQDKLILTEAVVQTTPVLFYRNGATREQVLRVAATDESVFNAEIVRVLFPEAEIVPEPSTKSCITAVAAGEALCTVVPAARINIVKNDPLTDDMSTAEMTKRLDIRLLASRESRRAATVFNKAILHASTSLNGAVLAEYANSGRDISVRAILERYSMHALGLFLLIIVLIGFQSARLARNKKKLARALAVAKTEHEAAESANERLTAQLGVVNSVAGVFFSLYLIDMNTGGYEVLGEVPESVRGTIGREGKAKEAFRIMCDTQVVSEYREAVLAFTDLSTLNARLKTRKWVSCRFLGESGGWAEGIFITVDRNADETLSRVIWGIRSITEEVNRELGYRKELERLTEEAQRANRAKTDFLFNMSHDIRTPMNAIIGYSRLVKERLTDPQLLDYQQKIERSSDLLLSIINNVLDMARIESGKVTIEESVVDTAKMMEQILSVFEEIATGKNLRLETAWSVGNARWLWADQTKIKEVFLNLISNAVKYTPEGGTVTIRAFEEPSDKPGYVRIRNEIEDTGIGMSAEYLPHLFDSFTRERNTTTGKVAGTGLGMPIVKKLVELMGGTISVESEQGKGTKFTVVLEHRIAEAPLNAQSGEGEGNDATAIAGKHILLAEDNELNTEIATIILGEMGCTVTHAEDGAKCVAAVEQAPAGTFDFILMDIQMPNMNGYDAARAIRSLKDPKKNSIPIVAMTANAFEEDRQNAFAAGMNGHIAKPIDPEKAGETIRSVLKQEAHVSAL